MLHISLPYAILKHLFCLTMHEIKFFMIYSPYVHLFGAFVRVNSRASTENKLSFQSQRQEERNRLSRLRLQEEAAMCW